MVVKCPVMVAKASGLVSLGHALTLACICMDTPTHKDTHMHTQRFCQLVTVHGLFLYICMHVCTCMYAHTCMT